MVSFCHHLTALIHCIGQSEVVLPPQQSWPGQPLAYEMNKLMFCKSLAFTSYDQQGSPFVSQRHQPGCPITERHSSSPPPPQAPYPLARTHSAFARAIYLFVFFSDTERQLPSSSLWSLDVFHSLSQTDSSVLTTWLMVGLIGTEGMP